MEVGVLEQGGRVSSFLDPSLILFLRFRVGNEKKNKKMKRVGPLP
jgi:hypothetical protein